MKIFNTSTAKFVSNQLISAAAQKKLKNQFVLIVVNIHANVMPFQLLIHVKNASEIHVSVKNQLFLADLVKKLDVNVQKLKFAKYVKVAHAHALNILKPYLAKNASDAHVFAKNQKFPVDLAEKLNALVLKSNLLALYAINQKNSVLAIKFQLLFLAQNVSELHACAKNHKFHADHADRLLVLASKYNNQFVKFASN